MGLFDFMKKSETNEDLVVLDTNTITTLIGKDAVISGNLETNASIRIDGKVTASVKCGGVVVVTKDAVVEGNVMAESIIIAGEVKGNIYIKDKVNIEASGRVTGDIYTNRFVIDENAVFAGKCNTNKDKPLDFSDFEKMIEEQKKAKEEKTKKPEASSRNTGAGNKNSNKQRTTRNRRKVEKAVSVEENKDSEIEIADIEEIDLKENN